MKLFQKLLLAPAALGLLAPAAANAADVNIAGLSQYGVEEQVTSITQFSDVQPTDWAYQALSNLIERYGCVAGYPNGTYRGNRAMTRYEAAALLNACLDRITEVTDELKRLMKEFERELAIIKGRVDGLEARVGELEATQFSTTTVLQGDTLFSVGAVRAARGSVTRNTLKPGTADFVNRTAGATVFNYDMRLNLKTSFTGKDLLYTRLRAGNYGAPFNGTPYNLMAMDRNTQGAGANIVQIDRLYYRFPLGKEFKFVFGPRGRNTENIGVKPFYYSNNSGLDYFALNGAPGAYNKVTGGIAGVIWKQKVKKGKPYFTASTNWVAPGSNNGNPNGAPGGIAGARSEDSWLSQIGYVASQWKVTAAINYQKCGADPNRRGTQAARVDSTCTYSLNGADQINNGGSTTSTALSAAWTPDKNGTWIPSVSLGWGLTSYNQKRPADSAFIGGGAAPNGSNGVNVAVANAGQTNVAPNLAVNNIATTQSWTVGLQWKDAFVKGNTAGMAVGQPSFVTATRNGTTPHDGNYAWEWFYKFQVSDNISVTPVVFYLSNPSSAGVSPSGDNPAILGAALTSRFKF